MFSGRFFDIFPIGFLFVQSHQEEIIIVKCLIQGCNNATRVEVKPRTRDRDHTVAVKTAL